MNSLFFRRSLFALTATVAIFTSVGVAVGQSTVRHRPEVAAIGLCAFAPDQIPPLVDAMAASGRAHLGIKFLSQSFGGFERATQFVEDFLLRTNATLYVTTYLDDGANRRRVRAWFRPDLNPTAFWNRCVNNNLAFLAEFQQALVVPYRSWVLDRMAWAMQRGLGNRLHFVCVPVLEDNANDTSVRSDADARRGYVNLLNACTATLNGVPVHWCRNPEITHCSADRIPAMRLANRPWVGFEAHGNRAALRQHLLAGDCHGNDGAFVSYRGETWVGTPPCDVVLSVAEWRNTVLLPGLDGSRSGAYWHPAFNGHWPTSDPRAPRARGTLRPFSAAPQLSAAIRGALAR